VFLHGERGELGERGLKPLQCKRFTVENGSPLVKMLWRTWRVTKYHLQSVILLKFSRFSSKKKRFGEHWRISTLILPRLLGELSRFSTFSMPFYLLQETKTK
jgi:hypothetical protein